MGGALVRCATEVGTPYMGMPKSHHRSSSLAVHVIVGDSPEKIGRLKKKFLVLGC